METLRGSITAVGFASGDRFVVGSWRTSPIGPFADVMWAQPDGSRVLLAPAHAADYITSVYPFEQVRHGVVEVSALRRRWEVRTAELVLSLQVGWAGVNLPPRPRRVTATVENWCARALLGVRTYGVSPTGVAEWYRTQRVVRVVQASAQLSGRDLGPLTRVTRPLGFGFTDPPQHPTHTTLRVDLRRPD
ncbi:hypothetical protein [Candidatus Poriferisocius sp.]|uniref:hypothetical protein n=1 Tax=Candidatus Poriferisocius sp. TaxID=3101276 RepID=UPI003B58F7B5